MTSKETRQYAMLVRVRKFGEKQRGLFPDSSIGGQAFASVAAAVAQLSADVKSKLSLAREGRGSKRNARRALVQRLDALGRTARLIAETTTGFDDPFRLPQLSKQSDETVLGVGRAFLKDAEPVKSQFIAHAMPETFLADFEALVNGFEEAIHGQDTVRTDQAAAQSGITEALESGLDAVRKLDILVANQLQDNRQAMSVWRTERRIGQRRGPRGRKRTAGTEPSAASVSTDAGTTASTAVIPSSASSALPGPAPAPATVSPAAVAASPIGEADLAGQAASTDIHSKVA